MAARSTDPGSVAGPSKRPDLTWMLLQQVVPLGASIGRIMKLRFKPVNLPLGFYGNVVHPDGASPWNRRAQNCLLFPKIPAAMTAKMKEAQQK